MVARTPNNFPRSRPSRRIRPRPARPRWKRLKKISPKPNRSRRQRMGRHKLLRLPRLEANNERPARVRTKPSRRPFEAGGGADVARPVWMQRPIHNRFCLSNRLHCARTSGPRTDTHGRARRYRSFATACSCGFPGVGEYCLAARSRLARHLDLSSENGARVTALSRISGWRREDKCCLQR